jgi:hypothetical protein
MTGGGRLKAAAAKITAVLSSVEETDDHSLDRVGWSVV